MIDYAAAQAVALIARTGSFETAAHMLHVTPSAISQRVRNLEERLGTTLIQRGQPCRPTPAGDRLCRHVEQVGLLETALLEHLPAMAQLGAAPRVTIEIATNADSLGTWLMPALAGFSQETGHLLNISIDDEQHTADWLRAGRVLAAVTSDPRPVRGCAVHPLGRLRYHATASPAFLARHCPQGVTPQSLAAAPALNFNQKDSLQRDWFRQVWGSPPVLSAHGLPSTQGFVDAAVAGLGWGLNPACLIEAHLASGALIQLRPEQPMDVALFWQVSRIAATSLSPLTRAVQTAAAQALLQSAPGPREG